MSPPPNIQPESDQLQVAELGAGDPLASFVPKSEDIASDLSPFEGIMSAASSASLAQGLGTVGNAFDPQPNMQALAGPSNSSMVQMQMDVLKSMSAVGASNVFLSDFPVAQQQQQQQVLAQLSVGEDMQGILTAREESPVSSSSGASPPPAGLFGNVSTSSLASALNEANAAQLLARSRSGSLISPNASLPSNGVTRTSPPVQSNEPSLSFPSLPQEFPNGVPPPPDPVTAPHMMVVDQFLTR